MKKNKLVCPHCKESDQVIKVSRLYYEKIASMKRSGGEENLVEEDEQTRALARSLAGSPVAKKLAPPKGGTQVLRMVHPDITVVGFGLILAFMAYRIYATQPQVGLPIAVVLVVCAALYLVFRKKIVGRFENRKLNEAADARRIEGAVGRWMKLYYCARDGGLFDSTSSDLFPVDGIDGYLYQKE